MYHLCCVVWYLGGFFEVVSMVMLSPASITIKMIKPSKWFLQLRSLFFMREGGGGKELCTCKKYGFMSQKVTVLAVIGGVGDHNSQ